MKFSKTASFFWMPACHDMFPGYKWMSHTIGPVDQASVKTNDELKIRRWVQGNIRMYAGWGSTVVPSGLAEGVLWTAAEERPNLPYVMVNVHDAPSKKTSPIHKKRGLLMKHHKVFQDSGGFQLISGASKFVDPIHVANAHLEYAAEGVGLDIPMANVNDTALLKACAAVQIANNKLIREITEDKVQLIAVSHGTKAKSRQEYLASVLDSEFDGLCIAGLRSIFSVYTPTFEEIALHLAYTIGSAKGQTNRFHVLGVSKFTSMILLAAAAKTLDVHITCDSATHILAGAGGATLDHRGGQISNHENKTMRARGDTIGVPPCHCEICHKLRYDFHWDNSRFLQTHAFRSLCKAHILACEEAEHYLKHVPIPYYAGLQKAVDILLEKPSPAKALKMLTDLQRHSPKPKGMLFAPPGSNLFEGRITAAVAAYGKYHKRNFMK